MPLCLTESRLIQDNVAVVPCIRGMRIRVIDILELLAAGLSFEQILEELPDLELEDIKAALLYGVRKLDRPVLAA